MPSLYNIEAKQTTVKNPTANSLIKQIYSTLKDQFFTKKIGNNYIGEVDYLLQIAFFAIRAATPSNCGYSSSQLAHGEDMFFCQQIHINWLALKTERQKQSMANNEKENKKRLEHTYKVNDLVLILKRNPMRWTRRQRFHCPHTTKVPTGSRKYSTMEQLRLYEAHTLTSSTSGTSSHTTRRKLINVPYLWLGPWEEYMLHIFLFFPLQTLFRFTDPFTRLNSS
jgi:hypothetical protein